MEEVKKKRNKALWIALGVVAVIIYLIVMMFFVPPHSAEVNKTGAAVVKYLKIKYNRDFEVRSGRFISANHSFEYRISPKDDKEFTFIVWSGMAGQSITETYLLMNEKRQLKLWIKPYLDTITKEHYVTAIGANTPTIILPQYNDYRKYADPILADIRTNKLTLQQTLNKYPGKLEVFVWCYFGLTITPENKDDVLRKVYNLYNFLNDKKFGKVDLSLIFINENKFINNSLLETLKQKGAGEVEHIALDYTYGVSQKVINAKNYENFRFFTKKEAEDHWKEAVAKKRQQEKLEKEQKQLKDNKQDTKRIGD